MSDKKQTGGNPANEPIQRLETEINHGTVICFGDCHWGHGEIPSTAYRALLKLCKELQPDLLVCMGDAIDGASVSRHPRLGWEPRPPLRQEIEEARERLAGIAAAAPEAGLVIIQGNHDARVNQWLSSRVPEMEGLPGFSLMEMLGPEWTPCMRLSINPEARLPCQLLHRMAGGATAGARNIAKTGTHTVTGHSHYLQLASASDYRGTRYGIQTGTLASLRSPAFRYTEQSETGWTSGFAVLNFSNGEMVPELVTVTEESEEPGKGTFSFRGKLWRV